MVPVATPAPTPAATRPPPAAQTLPRQANEFGIFPGDEEINSDLDDSDDEIDNDDRKEDGEEADENIVFCVYDKVRRIRRLSLALIWPMMAVANLIAFIQPSRSIALRTSGRWSSAMVWPRSTARTTSSLRRLVTSSGRTHVSPTIATARPLSPASAIAIAGHRLPPSCQHLQRDTPSSPPCHLLTLPPIGASAALYSY